MPMFKADCPHCGTRSVAFTLIAENQAATVENFSWDTFAICGFCGRGILANFETYSSEPPGEALERGGPEALSEPEIFPSTITDQAPKHTPKNVTRFYTQGVDNLQKHWDAAGSMFRKALEAALKNKFPDGDGDLYHRIEGAKKAGGLTADLAEWSHQIRLDGRNAVHEEEPYSKEEAERLHTFTNLALQYLFTLPGMLKEAKGAELDDIIPF